MAYRLKILCIVLAFNLFACSNSTNTVSCKDLLSEPLTENLNVDVTVAVPPHINSFKIGESVFLGVDNNSDAIIEVAPDKDIKFYRQNGSSWTEVENHVDYLSVIDLLLPSTSDDPGGSAYQVILEIPPQSAPIGICIILEGTKEINNHRSKVSAFTEIVLNP